MKKLLLILPADKKINRIIRRGVIIFLLSGLVAVGNDVILNSGLYISATWAPVIVAILASLDKALREYRE